MATLLPLKRSSLSTGPGQTAIETLLPETIKQAFQVVQQTAIMYGKANITVNCILLKDVSQ